MKMYNKQVLIEKADEIFEDLIKQSYEIIAAYPDFFDASKTIVDLVSSEVLLRSKTLIIDIYAEMSKNTLSSAMFDDAARKSRFYEANIRRDILSKYQFDIAVSEVLKGGIQSQEINCLYSSLAVAGGTAALGGILKHTLTASVNIPIVVIISAAVVVFCISYSKVIPDQNRANFRKAAEEFLGDLKKEFVKSFDEIETYYNNRIQDLLSAFEEGI